MNDFTCEELKRICYVRPRLQSTFVNRIRRYWCPYVQSKFLCDCTCSANFVCAKNIRQAIEGIRDGAEDPVALLVYRLRRQKAITSEEMAAAEHTTIGRNPLGEAVTGDAFQRIKVMIGD